jgi:hypothetical protein
MNWNNPAAHHLLGKLVRKLPSLSKGLDKALDSS